MDALGDRGESGAAFDVDLVEVEGSGEQAVGEVGVGEDQERGVHALHRRDTDRGVVVVTEHFFGQGRSQVAEWGRMEGDCRWCRKDGVPEVQLCVTEL
jgi:hypothetical protein